MDQIQIRKVAIGGYHRGDVDKVLSTMRKAESGAAYEREKALQEAQQENNALRARLEEMDRLEGENRRLRQALEKKEAEQKVLEGEKAQALAQLENLKRAEAQAASRYAQLRQEYGQMKGQLERYAQGSQAYDALKADIGQIEMDARLRAKRLVDEGDAKAAQALSEAQDKITSVNQRYEQLRESLNATLTHVAAQLQEIRAQVQGLDTALDRDSAALEAFLDQAGETLALRKEEREKP